MIEEIRAEMAFIVAAAKTASTLEERHNWERLIAAYQVAIRRCYAGDYEAAKAIRTAYWAANFANEKPAEICLN